MKKITEDEFKRLFTDEYKACNGCFYRFKDKGQLSRRNDEKQENIYGCKIGDIEKLTKLEYTLPENCRYRNFLYKKDLTAKLRKKTNNCRVCSIMMENNTACREKSINLLYCPCKNCSDFLVTENSGCLNMTDKCKSNLKYEVKEKIQIEKKIKD